MPYGSVVFRLVNRLNIFFNVYGIKICDVWERDFKRRSFSNLLKKSKKYKRSSLYLWRYQRCINVLELDMLLNNYIKKTTVEEL